MEEIKRRRFLFNVAPQQSFPGGEDLEAMLALRALCPHCPILGAHSGHSSRARTILAQSFHHYAPSPFLSKRLLLGPPRAAAAPHQPPERSKRLLKDEEKDDEWPNIVAPDTPGFPPEEEEVEVEEAEEEGDVAVDSDNQDIDDAGKVGHRKPCVQAAIFGLWCFQVVVFNICNKKALTVFPYPWLLASFHLLAGSLWTSWLWVSGIQSRRRVNRKFFFALLAPALFHAVGHVSSVVAFSKLELSFAHVMKTSEPFFSVVLSALHGHFFPIHVWLSVVPVVAGCALAVATEANLNVQGLWAALIGNAGFSLRNIYSTESLNEFKHVDGITLYGWTSIASLIFLLPVAVLIEGRHWVHGYRTALAAVPSPWQFHSWVLLSAVFYHLHSRSSYRALYDISPLAFSVGNTLKRAVVIAASVAAFRSPVTPLNALGSAAAIFGSFLYSQVTSMGKCKKKDKVVTKEEF